MSTAQVDVEAARRIDPEWALEHRMMPTSVDRARGILLVATTDPTQSALLSDVSARFGTKGTPVVATDSELGRLIRHAYFGEALDRTRGGSTLTGGPPLSEPSSPPAKAPRRRVELPPFPTRRPPPEAITEPAAISAKGLAYPKTTPDAEPARPDTNIPSPRAETVPLGSVPRSSADSPSSASEQTNAWPAGHTANTPRPLSETPIPLGTPKSGGPTTVPPAPSPPSSSVTSIPSSSPIAAMPSSGTLPPPLTPALPGRPLSAGTQPLTRPSTSPNAPRSGPASAMTPPALPASSIGAPRPWPISGTGHPTGPLPTGHTGGLPGAAPLSPGGPSADLSSLGPVVELHEYTAAAIRAIFELCVARGIITREEYLARLNATDGPAGR